MNCVHQAALTIETFPGSIALQNSKRKSGVAVTPKAGCILDLGCPVDAPFLTPDVLLAGLRYLHAAQLAVAGNKPQSRRLELVRLPCIYVILMRWQEIRQHARKTGQAWLLPGRRLQAYAEFAEVCEEFNITQLGESWSHRDLPWLKNICNGTLEHYEIP